MTIEFRGVIRGVEIDLTSQMYMLHRIVKYDGSWRFAKSVAIFDHDSMSPALPGSRIELRQEDLEGRRPSYRMLGEWMEEHGFSVPDDRYGTDLPGDLAELYENCRAWVGGGSDPGGRGCRPMNRSTS